MPFHSKPMLRPPDSRPAQIHRIYGYTPVALSDCGERVMAPGSPVRQHYTTDAAHQRYWPPLWAPTHQIDGRPGHSGLLDVLGCITSVSPSSQHRSSGTAVIDPRFCHRWPGSWYLRRHSRSIVYPHSRLPLGRPHASTYPPVSAPGEGVLLDCLRAARIGRAEMHAP